MEYAAENCTIVFLDEPDTLLPETLGLQKQQTSTHVRLAVKTTGKSQTGLALDHCALATGS
jgi:hypothetical protein